MADTQTTVYNLTKPEVGASEDTWGEKLNTNLDALDDLLSGSTTLQGAKLDDTTRIVDNADATKIVALSAGNLTTATTRTFTFPDATGTFVLNDNTATLTNKTLTSPAILTGFTFDGTTVTALSGADTTVVTGTAGTSGNVAAWNADGDVVDGGSAPFVETSGLQTLTSIAPAFGSGSITINTSWDDIAWVRQGSLVYARGDLRVASVSSPTGTAVDINTALPYDVAVDGNSQLVWFSVGFHDDSAGTYTTYVAYAINDIIRVYMNPASIAANDELLFSFTYNTDDA